MSITGSLALWPGTELLDFALVVQVIILTLMLFIVNNKKLPPVPQLRDEGRGLVVGVRVAARAGRDDERLAGVHEVVVGVQHLPAEGTVFSMREGVGLAQAAGQVHRHALEVDVSVAGVLLQVLDDHVDAGVEQFEVDVVVAEGGLPGLVVVGAGDIGSDPEQERSDCSRHDEDDAEEPPGSRPGGCTGEDTDHRDDAEDDPDALDPVEAVGRFRVLLGQGAGLIPIRTIHGNLLQRCTTLCNALFKHYSLNLSIFR